MTSLRSATRHPNRNATRTEREDAFREQIRARGWAVEALTPFCYRMQNNTGLRLLIWPGTLRMCLQTPKRTDIYRGFNTVEQMVRAIDHTRKAGSAAEVWGDVAPEDVA